jgi:uncharacterized protein
MQSSIFNVFQPVPDSDLVFLVNTLSDARMLVSNDVVELLQRCSETRLPDADVQRAAVSTLADHGILAAGPDREWTALQERFDSIRENRTELRITVLTTLECNFACEYCLQGSQGLALGLAQSGRWMKQATADNLVIWICRQMDTVRPATLALTFFGGEPLLNLPIVNRLAGDCWAAAKARGIGQVIDIVTNGLLLTPDVVDQLIPYGLNGARITLDGDRAHHDRLRPLRGGQGTFDRIVSNIAAVAGKCSIAIGGNVNEPSVDGYVRLLDYLKEQRFADAIADVTFKPVLRKGAAGSGSVDVDVAGNGSKAKCSRAAGAAFCAASDMADERVATLRAETRRRGLPVSEGLYLGPCDLYHRHSHTVGPDGSIYPCPGFSGEAAFSVGHVARDPTHSQQAMARRFEELSPWKACGTCPFIPACGGGCAVAAHMEQGDMTAPACHRRAFESALMELAEYAATDG